MRPMERFSMRMPDGPFFLFPVIPIIALIIFLTFRIVNKKRRIQHFMNHGKMTSQETELFLKSTPRRYWKKAEMFFCSENINENIQPVEKQFDPLEDLINQFAHNKITIEEYEKRVGALV